MLGFKGTIKGIKGMRVFYPYTYEKFLGVTRN